MTRKQEKLRNATGLLKQLSHPVRLSILCNLLHKGEMSVGELIEAENGAAGQSQISQFLAKMRQEELVSCRKDAQTVYYRIKSVRAKKIIKVLYEIFCERA